MTRAAGEDYQGEKEIPERLVKRTGHIENGHPLHTLETFPFSYLHHWVELTTSIAELRLLLWKSLLRKPYPVKPGTTFNND